MRSPLRWFDQRAHWQKDLVIAILLEFVAVLCYGFLQPNLWRVGCFAAVCVGLLVLRRRFPCTIFWVLAVATSVSVLVRDTTVWVLIPALWPALHTVSANASRSARRWNALVIAVVDIGLIAVMLAVRDPLQSPVARTVFSTTVLTGGFLGSAWLAGGYTRLRKAYLDEVRTRLETAAAQERAWVARELHDMLAHTMSGMVVLAGGARRLGAHEPAAALLALERIEQTGRDGMRQARELVRVLRESASAAEQPPAASLAELDTLADIARAAGLRVRLDIEGEPADIPQPVQVAAYRIAQESVTNVLRHAEASTLRLLVSCQQQRLELEITDDGTGNEPGTAGFGIAGMRERARQFGGELSAGRTELGWVVRARLEVPA